ncbi:hypothetical protein [Kitasatospora sp. CB02891]|uniref:hypothetical protein n=1 Tax=Kitasatospora sp. CB02891 TaxID=2020329 RepID=UPI000C272A4E|nr:hypothetical protein [Kitasatospora sp. CB02891]PJN24069.1 hypothetical protein CG736_19430 [Kitasatospora sp. CB02891]
MSAYTLAWFGCDLRTGAIAEELRALRPTQALTRRIGAATSVPMELDLAGAPPHWEAATDQGRTLQVAVDETTGAIVWAGITAERDGGSSQTLTLGAATAESYLDRRYPGDYTATATDATTVMAALAAPAASLGPPIEFDTAPSGLLIDYSMRDLDDKTVMSGLQEIADMAGAPEWTVDVVWADAAQTRVKLVVRIRPAIGIQLAVPGAVFDFPGCIGDYRLTESYDRGRGATRTVARGELVDGVRTTSTVHTADSLIAAGWCLWERRWTPSAGITDTAQLDRHATEAITLMGTGSRAWTVNAVASRAPRLGTDWSLGDTIAISIDRSPRHPAGAQAVARAYAWSLDAAADRVSPILLEDT